MDDPYRAPSHGNARPPGRPTPPPRWVQHRPWSLILLLANVLVLAAGVVVLVYGARSAVAIATAPQEPEPPKWAALGLAMVIFIVGSGLILGILGAVGMKLTIKARHQADEGNPEGLRTVGIVVLAVAAFGAILALAFGFPWGVVICGLYTLPALFLYSTARPIKGWGGPNA